MQDQLVRHHLNDQSRFKLAALCGALFLPLGVRAGDSPAAPTGPIVCEVLEISSGACRLTVQCGARQGVTPGAGCSVVDDQGTVIDTCIIDRVYPNLTKVRPMGSCAKIPKRGTVIQIQVPRS